VSPEGHARSGALVLVVGPSGAGKDTIMRRVHDRLGPGSGIVFARRVVTRAADAAEDNEVATDETFLEALGRGGFVLDWQAHGLRYGVPRQVCEELAQGRVVVVNVSRTVVPRARSTFDRVRIVLLTAPAEIRASRISARGRDADAAERLAREPLPLDELRPDLTIDNAGTPEAAVDRLQRFLIDLIGRTRPVGERH
jgi:ribose 1,5-bisphosphokinase